MYGSLAWHTQATKRVDPVPIWIDASLRDGCHIAVVAGRASLPIRQVLVRACRVDDLAIVLYCWVMCGDGCEARHQRGRDGARGSGVHGLLGRVAGVLDYWGGGEGETRVDVFVVVV